MLLVLERLFSIPTVLLANIEKREVQNLDMYFALNKKLVRDFVAYYCRTFLFPIIESKQFLSKKEFAKRNRAVDFAIVNPLAIRVKFFEYASFFSAKTLSVLKHDDEESPLWDDPTLEGDAPLAF